MGVFQKIINFVDILQLVCLHWLHELSCNQWNAVLFNLLYFIAHFRNQLKRFYRSDPVIFFL